ncbi:MAG: 2,3,4,5-tetrahydropyridine-2,6-dicarboxylate N-succinyltransferase, partial [Rhodothermales bacterium]|nr:2,3,4,5-tetrahydropyridine-2,6-dicarboxylate N-succinyltransferase [Rhodothermales bacterium]
MQADDLRRRLDALDDAPHTADPDAAADLFAQLLAALNDGTVRAASRRDDGTWQAHPWVKRGILLGFRLGRLTDFSTDRFPFFDKHT